jgi:hypothetical protein
MAAYRDTVYGAKLIVTNLYGSLQGQRQFMLCMELAGWPFVSQLMALGELFGTTAVVERDKFGHLKSC